EALRSALRITPSAGFPNLTCDYLVTYDAACARRRPDLQGARGPHAALPARPTLRAPRPHARAARVRARDDAPRCHEAPARAGGRRPRRHGPPGPGKASLPQPGADPADPRPLDRQVHGAPRLGAPRPQDNAGGKRMSTMTATTTQVYQLYIKTTPEQLWDALV